MEIDKNFDDSKQPKASGIKMSTKGLDVLITVIISLVFFLVPLFFTGMSAQGMGFEKIILFYFLVLVGIVAWVTKGVILGELNIKRTPLDIPILVTILLFSVSTILSVSTKDSLIGSYGSSSKGFIILIVFALFYYLLVNNLNTAKIKIFFWSLVSSVGLISVFSILQLNEKFLLPLQYSHNSGFNPLGSLSGLTMFLVIGLPLLVVGAAQLREILPKVNPAIAVGMKVVLGVFTLSSLVVLMFLSGFTFWPIPVVGMVIILMFFMAKIIKISSTNLMIPLGAFLALIILLVMGNFNFKTLNLPAEVSLSRSASWDIAKSSIAENPIFGSGPSTFYYNFSKFKDIDFNNSPLWNVRFDSSSGAVFELLSTVGVFGALSVIVLTLIALSISFLSLLKTKNKETNSILLGLFSSFVSAVLLSILFPQNNALILVSLIVIILAIAVSLESYSEKFSELKLSFRSSAKYALALAAVFLFVSSGVVVVFTMGLKMYLADVYAKDSLRGTNNVAKIEMLNKAIDLAPYQDTYYLSAANYYMAIANKAAIEGKDQLIISDSIGEAIKLGKEATRIAPNKAGNSESLALVYENASFYLRGALEWSEELYKKVVELDPLNPTPYLRIALINMARANSESDDEEKKHFIEEAIKSYDQAIQKKGDLAVAYYGKAIASEKLNDLDNAIEQLKNANLLAKTNLDYRFELGRMYFNRGVSNSTLKQSQDVTKKIADNEESTDDQLSVDPNVNQGNVINRNSDLNTSEQLFLSILLPAKQGGNPNHANARYSLAVMYQKVGENSKARTMVDSLLNILKDERVRSAVREQFSSLY